MANDFTQLLHDVEAGREEARAELVDAAYSELRLIAAGAMESERRCRDGNATLVGAKSLLAMSRGQTAEARWAAMECVELSRRCGALFLEVGLRGVYQGLTAKDDANATDDLLVSAVGNCREAWLADAAFLLPVSLRALVAALTAESHFETAARACGLADTLFGIGVRDEYNPNYAQAQDRLRIELNTECFDQLCAEGRQWTVPELLETAERLAEETKRSKSPDQFPDRVTTNLP